MGAVLCAFSKLITKCRTNTIDWSQCGESLSGRSRVRLCAAERCHQGALAVATVATSGTASLIRHCPRH